MWKSKHDTLSLNRATSSDLENRRLLNEIEKLKEYKTTLINSAVTGKIKVV